MSTEQYRRAAIDHVIELAAGSPLNDQLILSGGMSMLAWFGDRARVSDAVEWIVRPVMSPVDGLSPYPYVNRLDAVQMWPELAHGAAGHSWFAFEDFETCGAYPRLPPDGLRWMTTKETAAGPWPHGIFLDIVDEEPETADGLLLDSQGAILYSTTGWCHTSSPVLNWYDESSRESYYGQTERRCSRCHIYLEEAYWDPGLYWEGGVDSTDPEFSQAEYMHDHEFAYEQYVNAGMVQLKLPWETEGASGALDVHIAYDEPLIETPMLTAIPRGDGRPPVAVWVAAPRQLLARAVQRLALDQANHGVSKGSDLYDAVLLAESLAERTPPRGGERLRSLLSSAPVVDHSALWRVDWRSVDEDHRPDSASGAREWLDRFTSAMQSITSQPWASRLR